VRLNKKVLKFMLMGLALVLLLVVSAEGFVHHHKHDEAHDRNCAYCHWNHTGSQAVTSEIQPLIFPLLLFGLLFVKRAEAVFIDLFFYTGKSPPSF
jgi:hypothetical protein